MWLPFVFLEESERMEEAAEEKLDLNPLTFAYFSGSLDEGDNPKLALLETGSFAEDG